MKITKLCAIAALGATAISSSFARILDWQLIGRGGPVVSGLRLTLWNITNQSNLKYGHQTWGINLVWDKKQFLHNVQIFNQGPLGSPILYTQPVAIYIQGGGY